MALQTRAKFYYGHQILEGSTSIDFDEGGPILTAELSVGYYSITEFIIEVQRALTEAGALIYAVGIDRSTRIITISASGTFALRKATGPHADNPLYDLLGYSGGDLTGANTYTFTNASGFEYKPQFFLLDWVGPDEDVQAVEANSTETGSGRIEVVTFGQKRTITMNIDFITDICFQDNDAIETNLTGKQDAIDFLKDIIKKGHVEFMPDRNDVDTYYTLLLESTASNRQGIGYKLNEKLGQGLPGYYSTGILTWRIVED
jgi:hypothetical protein